MTWFGKCDGDRWGQKGMCWVLDWKKRSFFICCIASLQNTVIQNFLFIHQAQSYWKQHIIHQYKKTWTLQIYFYTFKWHITGQNSLIRHTVPKNNTGMFFSWRLWYFFFLKCNILSSHFNLAFMYLSYSTIGICALIRVFYFMDSFSPFILYPLPCSDLHGAYNKEC